MTVTCACGCGVQFEPRKRNQIYATEQCRKNAWWSKHETIGPVQRDALQWALFKLRKHKDDIHYVTLQTLVNQIKE